MQLITPIKKCQRPHKCEWCGELIVKDSSAFKIVGINNEGDFFHGHLHPECKDAEKTLMYIEEGWYPYSFKRGTIDEK
jgi:hypothetical protein